MKIRFVLSTTIATLLSSAASHAATLTWDGAGGSTWDTSSSNWTGSPWTDSSDALFAGAGTGAITVSGTRTVASLTTSAAGYSLTGGQINLGSATTIFAINNDLTIGSMIGGGGNGLAKSGAGTLTLTGTNTYTGVTTINSGTLQLGDGTSGHDGALASPSIVNNGNLVYNTFGSVSTSEVISGTGSLTKTGAGTLILTASSAFTGPTAIAAGTLWINGATANLGSNSALTLANASGVSFLNLYWNGSTNVGANLTIGSLAGGGSLGGNITLFPSTMTVGTDNTSTTYAGVISESWGSASVTKVGTGTLTFTGANTYTGTTTISAGTLQVGDGTTDGSIATSSGIVNNAAIVFNLNGSQTYNHVISGSGTLTKSGPGTLTLSGVNTYSGATIVNSGTLSDTYGSSKLSPNSAVVLANVAGATLNLAYGETIGSLSGGGANGGNVRTAGWWSTFTVGGDNTSTTYAGDIHGGGLLAKTGTGTVTLTGTNFTDYNSGAYLVVNSGVLEIAGAGILAGSGQNSPGTVNTGGTLRLNSTATADGGLAYWNLWSGLTVNGGAIETNLGSGISILFTMGAGGATLGGSGVGTETGVLSGLGSLTKTGAGMWTLTGSNTYTGATSVTSGTLRIGAGGTAGLIGSTSGVLLSSTGSTLAFNRTDSYGGSFATAISGSGNLTLLTGALTLAGSNTYTGVTTITGGTLALGNANALPSGGGVVFGGGVLQYGGSNQMDCSGQIVGSTGAVKIDTNGQNITFATGLASSNTGGLIKSGAGTLTLTGSHAYAGATTVGAGTLQIGDGANDGSIAASSGIANNGALVYNLAGNQVYSGAISGTGAFTKSGGGTLILTGSNSTTGAVSVTGGTLQIGNGSSGSVSGTTVSLGSGATLAVNLANSGTLGSAISIFGGALNAVGSGTNTLSGNINGYAYGTFNQSGAGTTILSGNNTFFGATNINAGALQLNYQYAAYYSTVNVNTANGLAFGTTAATIGGLSGTSGFSLLTTSGTGVNLSVGNNNADTTYAGVIAGSNPASGLTKVGIGTLTLTGSSTYIGATTISAGTLQIGNGTTDGSIAASSGISNGSALVCNVASNQSIGCVISGTGTFTKSGAGTLTFTAANTYSATTTINSGTLQFGDGTTGHDGSISNNSNIVNNGNLLYNLSGFESYNGVISGPGSITKSGSGTLELNNGAHTYSGATTINGGVLQLLQPAATLGSGSSAVTLANVSGALLNLNPHNWGTASISIGSLSGGGTSGGNVDLHGDTLTVGSDNTSTTFSGAILSSSWGVGNLIKVGTGTLTLTGGNTYSGLTTVSGGVLAISSAGVIASAVTINAGGTLQIGDGTTDGSVASTSGIFNNGTLAFNLAGSQTYSHVISGSGTLTKSGAGTLTLSGVNTYSGATIINSGILADTYGTSKLSPNSAVVLANTAGATLSLAYSETIGSLSGGGANGGNVKTAGWWSTFTVGGDNTSTTYAGDIHGGGLLAKTGTGTLTLTGTNFTDYNSGAFLVVNSGVLEIAGAGILAGSGQNSPGTVNAGGTLRLNSTATADGGLAYWNLWSGLTVNGGAIETNLASGISILFTMGAGGATVGGSGVGTETGVLSGSGSLTKAGTGTWTLTGSNSYSGGTTISGGAMQIGNANALGTGGVTVNGGTLDLRGHSVSVGALNGSGGTIINTVSGTSTLTTSVASGTSTYAGEIGNDTGAVVLTNSGAGTLILSGSLTMSGLNANAGMTVVARSGSIGAVNVAAGATVVLAAHSDSAYNVLDISSLTLAGFSSALTVGNNAAPAVVALNADSLAGCTDHTMLAANEMATNGTTGSSNAAPASPEAVPEPGTLGLILSGLGLFLSARPLRRRSSK